MEMWLPAEKLQDTKITIKVCPFRFMLTICHPWLPQNAAFSCSFFSFTMAVMQAGPWPKPSSIISQNRPFFLWRTLIPDWHCYDRSCFRHGRQPCTEAGLLDQQCVHTIHSDTSSTSQVCHIMAKWTSFTSLPVFAITVFMSSLKKIMFDIQWSSVHVFSFRYEVWVGRVLIHSMFYCGKTTAP